MSKWSYAVYTLLRFLTQAAALILLFSFIASIQFYFNEQQSMGFAYISQWVASNPVFQLLLLIMIFVNGRTVLFRLDDKEI
jgi:hypothetical protein